METSLAAAFCAKDLRRERVASRVCCVCTWATPTVNFEAIGAALNGQSPNQLVGNRCVGLCGEVPAMVEVGELLPGNQAIYKKVVSGFMDGADSNCL